MKKVKLGYKKNYGSKKAKKRAEFEEREFARKKEKERIKNYNKVMREGTLEEMSNVMGIKLK
jgi:hypothetical protein